MKSCGLSRLLLVGFASALAATECKGGGSGGGAKDPGDRHPGDAADWALLSVSGTIILVFGQLLVLGLPPYRHLLSCAIACSSALIGDTLIVFGMSRHAVLYAQEWEGPERAAKVAAGVAVGLFLLLFNVLIYAVHRSNMRHEAERREEVEGNLPEILATGQMRLLNVSWLIAQPADYTLMRRQDLEAIEEALVSPARAVRLLSMGRVAALSYKWLDPFGCDPDGFHLEAVRQFYFRADYPVTSAMRQWMYPALFWDFASCPQKGPNGEPRSPNEQRDFEASLKVMNSTYATPRTLVLQHRRTPTRPEQEQGQGKRRPLTYDESGWCTVEQSLASLAASARCVVRHHELGKGWVAWEYSKLTPAEMRELLETKRFQNDNVDRTFVCQLYTELYEKVQQFDAANTPWLVARADALVNRCRVSPGVGMEMDSRCGAWHGRGGRCSLGI